MPENLVERYVLVDAYGWSTDPGRRDGRLDYHVARKGDRIHVSADEAARGESLGGLSAAAADVEAAVAASTEPPSWDDAQLDAANVDDTVAYLAQHPSEAVRVAELENTRDDRGLKVRKGVLEAAERVNAAYVEELEEAAAARDAADEAEQAAYAATSGVSSPAPRIP